MSKNRRQYSADFKFKVALQAAKTTKTLSEIASETGIHPNQISQWKRQLLDAGPAIFSTSQLQQQREQATRETALFEQIGRLNMELEWLKKKVG